MTHWSSYEYILRIQLMRIGKVKQCSHLAANKHPACLYYEPNFTKANRQSPASVDLNLRYLLSQHSSLSLLLLLSLSLSLSFPFYFYLKFKFSTSILNRINKNFRWTRSTQSLGLMFTDGQILITFFSFYI